MSTTSRVCGRTREVAVLSLILFSLTACASLGSSGRTQPSVAAGPQRASRTELAARAALLESQIASVKTSGNSSSARAELQAIRERLTSGDFKVGDRFTITVRQDTVRADTASVRDSLKVAVLNLPDLSLQGVLRSELDDAMQRHIARYVRNAAVRTSVLTRISVLGAIKQPGFYYVTPDRPVSDLFIVSGGPAPDAKPSTIEVFRDGKRLLGASDGERLVKSGSTIEQADIRSGDEVRVPTRKKINWQLVMQLFLIASSLLFALLGFVQWYYSRQDG